MVTERRTVDRLRSGYAATALLFFNVLLLFVFANVGVALALSAWHRWHRLDLGPEVRQYGLERLGRAYTGWRREDLLAFFAEATRANKWQYEPYTGFRPEPFRGRFVNVSANGYRENGRPAEWPPSSRTYNVFWFGGSTAFGVGVPDGQTIASALERALAPEVAGKPAVVYNFGRPGYFSVQEGILFQELLRAGRRPDLAIFLDGLNDFYYREPAMTPALARMVDEATIGGLPNRILDLAGALPIVRLPVLAKRRRSREAEEPGALATGMTARQTVERWLENRRIVDGVAREFGSRALFVWQPVPSYHYDIQFDLFADPENFARWKTPEGYSLVSQLRSQGNLPADVLWLGDLQADKRENLYVDRFHYTARFSGEIAAAIASFVRSAPPPDPGAKTP